MAVLPAVAAGAATLSRRCTLRMSAGFGLACASALPAARAQTEPVTFALVIRDGAVAREQKTLKVVHRARVRIVWSSDRPMTVHLEGYNISVAVEPDRPAEMAFEAYATGRFPVHAHFGSGSPSGSHSHGRDVLLRFEVYPP